MEHPRPEGPPPIPPDAPWPGPPCMHACMPMCLVTGAWAHHWTLGAVHAPCTVLYGPAALLLQRLLMAVPWHAPCAPAMWCGRMRTDCTYRGSSPVKMCTAVQRRLLLATTGPAATQRSTRARRLHQAPLFAGPCGLFLEWHGHYRTHSCIRPHCTRTCVRMSDKRAIHAHLLPGLGFAPATPL